jgi:type IV pilus assembly protein PilA
MSFVERCQQRRLDSQAGDEGFTLIELLVVLLIIGILLAIAIPTFLSVTKGANNTASQSNLQNALTGAKTYYTDSNQTYTGLLSVPPVAGTSNLQQIGTGLSYVATASTGSHVISYVIGGGTVAGSELTLAAFSPGSNDCWMLLDNTSTNTAVAGWTGSAQSGTYYGVVHNATPVSCIATATPTTTSTTGFPAP